MEQYYHMLGVLPTTKLKDIKKKYFKLMRKTHPDKSGQDEQCKKITEAYRKIIRHRLENIVDDDDLIPIGFNYMSSEKDIPESVNETMKHAEKKDPKLVLMDKHYKKKSMFEKMFDFFFNLNSDDESSSDESSSSDDESDED